MLKSMLLAIAILIGSSAGVEAQTYTNGGGGTPSTTVGWNFGYLSYCFTYFDGFNTWHYGVGEGGGYGYTNNPGFIALVAPACQTGNLIAIFVTSINPFSWSHLAVFPHK